MLARLGRILITVLLALATLAGVAIAIGATVDLFRGHDDPSLAGEGRLHDPKIATEECRRSEGICEIRYEVKLDLPGGTTETIDRESLYDLVREEGPITVDVEWVEDLHSATRVRYEDRWYRAAYPADVQTLFAIVLIPVGLALAFFAGVFFLDRILPDEPG